MTQIQYVLSKNCVDPEFIRSINQEIDTVSYQDSMILFLTRDKFKNQRFYDLLKANPVSQTELSEVSESDAAKGLRNYGRMYKQGLGMKPDTNYEYSKGGKVGSASKRADGIAKRGKTRGKIV